MEEYLMHMLRKDFEEDTRYCDSCGNWLSLEEIQASADRDYDVPLCAKCLQQELVNSEAAQDRYNEQQLELEDE